LIILGIEFDRKIEIRGIEIQEIEFGILICNHPTGKFFLIRILKIPISVRKPQISVKLSIPPSPKKWSGVGFGRSIFVNFCIRVYCLQMYTFLVHEHGLHLRCLYESRWCILASLPYLQILVSCSSLCVGRPTVSPPLVFVQALPVLFFDQILQISVKNVVYRFVVQKVIRSVCTYITIADVEVAEMSENWYSGSLSFGRLIIREIGHLGNWIFGKFKFGKSNSGFLSSIPCRIISGQICKCEVPR